MLTFERARLLALLLPVSLLGGAYIAQFGFNLSPCEMCWWQRYPHFAALIPALLSFVAGSPNFRRVLVALAAFAILSSAFYGAFHAGVEYGWWEGNTKCSSMITGSGEEFAKAILKAPLTRCDVAPWSLFGISLAGYNFLLSATGGIAILWSIWRNR